MVVHCPREDWEKINGVIPRLKPHCWHFRHCGCFCQSSVSYFRPWMNKLNITTTHIKPKCSGSPSGLFRLMNRLSNPSWTLRVNESYVDLGLGPKIKGAAEYFSTCITQPAPTLEIHSCPASRFLPLCRQHGNGAGLAAVLVVCSVSYSYTRPSSETGIAEWLAQCFYESNSWRWSWAGVRRLIASWRNWFISSANFLSEELKCW